MDINTTDLETLSEPELRELIMSAQTALDRRVAERAKTTLREIKRLAAEVGFEVNFQRAGKAAGGKGAAGKAGTPRGKAAQKYRNPANSSETWSGRGRPPKWVQRLQAEGTTLDELRIAPAA
jgi:DNA-binding protein H-NS